MFIIGPLESLAHLLICTSTHKRSLCFPLLLQASYTACTQNQEGILFFFHLHFILDNKKIKTRSIYSTTIKDMQPFCTQFQYCENSCVLKAPLQCSVKPYLIKSYKVIHGCFRIQTLLAGAWWCKNTLDSVCVCVYLYLFRLAMNSQVI